MVIFAHNHKKSSKSDYEYISLSPLSWKTVRDPCYKYSVEAQTDFFNIPELAFLFCLFAKSDKTGSFCKQDKRDRVMREVAKLAEIARDELTAARNHPLKKAFIAYLNE